MTPIKEDAFALRQAAFVLETVAHLRGFERELLPIAEKLREIAERTYPTIVRRDLHGRNEGMEQLHD